MNAVSNAEVSQVSKTEIAILPPAARAVVVLKSEKTRAELAELVKQSAGILTVTNKDGREECHRAYMNLKNTRVAITHTVEEATEDAKAFTKAVKTEAANLILITQAEEDRLQTLRDEFDAKIEAEKAAKIAAERARVERIEKMIDQLRNYPLMVLAEDPAVPSAALKAAIDEFDGWEPHVDDYAEYAPEAAKVIAESLVTMRTMMEKELTREKAAADAEAARLAEVARMEAERAELTRLRAEQAERERLAKIESDRIAAEQAVEAKRLADLAAAQKAEQDRVAADVKRQLEAQQAQIAEQARKLAEQQAAADARDAAALAAQQDAARREADHGIALEMNAEFDAAREIERARLQVLADQAAADHLEQVADERATGLPAGSLRPDALAEHLQECELWPSDSEIVSEIRARFLVRWGMDEQQADARMGRFVWAAAVAVAT